MFEKFLRPSALAAAIALATLASPPVAAQSAGTRIPVGLNPTALAVNPVTNKVYVANSGADTVTVINANSGSTATVAVGDFPNWVAINPETNKIYVSNLIGASTSIIRGATDTVSTTTASGGGGWTAINPLINTAYVIRYGGSDEVNTIQDEHYEVTSATRSYEPVSIAVNPVNNWMYVAHKTTGDIVAMDITVPQPYPPLYCPDGAGGFKPQPPIPPFGTPDTYRQPCIDIPGTPVAVAINPLTNKIYAVTSAPAQVHVINGANSTFTSLTPSGTPGEAKTIAVNPITNKIYAAFRNSVVVVDGASNAMTVIPAGSGAGGPVAIGINVLTNMIYVPSADGTLLSINGATNATSTIAIAANANAISVNPLTNTIFVLDAAGGVTPVTGAAGSATSTGITTTITPLGGNTGGTSGSIQLNASSSMSAPFNAVRKVYYRFDSTGPWTLATGTGPYTAAYSGLAAGAHSIEAVATNSLEAPSINTDLASVPIVGNIASYAFTTSTSVFPLNVIKAGNGAGTVTSSPAGINCGTTCSFNFASGSSVALTATPASGMTFQGWSGGGCSGTGACNVTVNAATDVTATFMNPDPPRLGNIATRGQVLTGNDVMIGGFVIGGSVNKTVVVRARGPSLAAFGITNALANPLLQLVRSSDQTQIASNDDWQSAANAAQVTASGFAPSHSLESAILMSLPPGAYTAIVSGVGGGTGVGIVEVFEVDHFESPLINIATRGKVLTGNDVMIGGFVIQGGGSQTVVVRGRGPSLVPFGITNALADPVLQLVRSSDQATIATNDDWIAASNASAINDSGFAPSSAKEAAILITLPPGAYTAILSGAGGGTGVGIIEVFKQ
jgi:YVTN family beta-propeller protein